MDKITLIQRQEQLNFFFLFLAAILQLSQVSTFHHLQLHSDSNYIPTPNFILLMPVTDSEFCEVSTRSSIDFCCMQLSGCIQNLAIVCMHAWSLIFIKRWQIKLLEYASKPQLQCYRSSSPFSSLFSQFKQFHAGVCRSKQRAAHV